MPYDDNLKLQVGRQNLLASGTPSAVCWKTTAIAHCEECASGYSGYGSKKEYGTKKSGSGSYTSGYGSKMSGSNTSGYGSGNGGYGSKMRKSGSDKSGHGSGSNKSESGSESRPASLFSGANRRKTTA